MLNFVHNYFVDFLIVVTVSHIKRESKTMIIIFD